MRSHLAPLQSLPVRRGFRGARWGWTRGSAVGGWACVPVGAPSRREHAESPLALAKGTHACQRQAAYESDSRSLDLLVSETGE